MRLSQNARPVSSERITISARMLRNVESIVFSCHSLEIRNE